MNFVNAIVKPFSTFEAREEAFRQRISTLLPRTHAGPSVFWKDFSRIFDRGDGRQSLKNVVYTTANPRDCLAFSTPRKVLLAAGMQAGTARLKRASFLRDVAHQFNLGKNLDQPIRSLSGGETVKLALAKVHILVDVASDLALASPFCWLDKDNRVYLEGVVRRYQEQRIPVTLFTLRGEDKTQKISDNRELGAGWFTPVHFHLTFNKVRLVLGSTLTAFNMPAPPRVRISDFEAMLASPCLWIGGNGQGKSLMAKVLSGATAYRGTARITVERESRQSRLLFQDVITQTLLRSFDVIRSQAFRNGPERTGKIYSKIMSVFNRLNYHEQFSLSGPKRNEMATLLETKAVLVAVRLARRSGVLILDEPDWGLSQMAARAFVAAVVDVSHDLGVPVILITHKPWWNAVANSRIEVLKSNVKTVVDGRLKSFQIGFKHVDRA